MAKLDNIVNEINTQNSVVINNNESASINRSNISNTSSRGDISIRSIRSNRSSRGDRIHESVQIIDKRSYIVNLA